MSRQLKPVTETAATTEIKKELTSEENVRVVTTDQMILNRLEYITLNLENLNVAISRIAKQAGFDLTKD